jgi:hypothetical protein
LAFSLSGEVTGLLATAQQHAWTHQTDEAGEGQSISRLQLNAITKPIHRILHLPITITLRVCDCQAKDKCCILLVGK